MEKENKKIISEVKEVSCSRQREKEERATKQTEKDNNFETNFALPFFDQFTNLNLLDYSRMSVASLPNNKYNTNPSCSTWSALHIENRTSKKYDISPKKKDSSKTLITNPCLEGKQVDKHNEAEETSENLSADDEREAGVQHGNERILEEATDVDEDHTNNFHIDPSELSSKVSVASIEDQEGDRYLRFLEMFPDQDSDLLTQIWTENQGNINYACEEALRLPPPYFYQEKVDPIIQELNEYRENVNNDGKEEIHQSKEGKKLVEESHLHHLENLEKTICSKMEDVNDESSVDSSGYMDDEDCNSSLGHEAFKHFEAGPNDPSEIETLKHEYKTFPCENIYADRYGNRYIDTKFNREKDSLNKKENDRDTRDSCSPWQQNLALLASNDVGTLKLDSEEDSSHLTLDALIYDEWLISNYHERNLRFKNYKSQITTEPNSTYLEDALEEINAFFLPLTTATESLFSITDVSTRETQENNLTATMESFEHISSIIHSKLKRKKIYHLEIAPSHKVEFKCQEDEGSPDLSVENLTKKRSGAYIDTRWKWHGCDSIDYKFNNIVYSRGILSRCDIKRNKKDQRSAKVQSNNCNFLEGEENEEEEEEFSSKAILITPINVEDSELPLFLMDDTENRTNLPIQVSKCYNQSKRAEESVDTNLLPVYVNDLNLSLLKEHRSQSKNRRELFNRYFEKQRKRKGNKRSSHQSELAKGFLHLSDDMFEDAAYQKLMEGQKRIENNIEKEKRLSKTKHHAIESDCLHNAYERETNCSHYNSTENQQGSEKSKEKKSDTNCTSNDTSRIKHSSSSNFNDSHRNDGDDGSDFPHERPQDDALDDTKTPIIFSVDLYKSLNVNNSLGITVYEDKYNRIVVKGLPPNSANPESPNQALKQGVRIGDILIGVDDELFTPEINQTSSLQEVKKKYNDLLPLSVYSNNPFKMTIKHLLGMLNQKADHVRLTFLRNNLYNEGNMHVDDHNTHNYHINKRQLQLNNLGNTSNRVEKVLLKAFSRIKFPGESYHKLAHRLLDENILDDDGAYNMTKMMVHIEIRMVLWDNDCLHIHTPMYPPLEAVASQTSRSYHQRRASDKPLTHSRVSDGRLRSNSEGPRGMDKLWYGLTQNSGSLLKKDVSTEIASTRRLPIQDHHSEKTTIEEKEKSVDERNLDNTHMNELNCNQQNAAGLMDNYEYNGELGDSSTSRKWTYQKKLSSSESVSSTEISGERKSTGGIFNLFGKEVRTSSHSSSVEKGVYVDKSNAIAEKKVSLHPLSNRALTNNDSPLSFLGPDFEDSEDANSNISSKTMRNPKVQKQTLKRFPESTLKEDMEERSVNLGEKKKSGFLFAATKTAKTRRIPTTSLRRALSIRINGSEFFRDHTVYAVWIYDVESGVEWYIRKRYRQFYELHEKLILLRPALATIDFPSKRRPSRLNTYQFVRERRIKLEKYLRRVAGLIYYAPNLHIHSCSIQKLLEEFLEVPKQTKRFGSIPLEQGNEIFAASIPKALVYIHHILCMPIMDKLVGDYIDHILDIGSKGNNAEIIGSEKSENSTQHVPTTSENVESERKPLLGESPDGKKNKEMDVVTIETEPRDDDEHQQECTEELDISPRPIDSTAYEMLDKLKRFMDHLQRCILDTCTAKIQDILLDSLVTPNPGVLRTDNQEVQNKETKQSIDNSITSVVDSRSLSNLNLDPSVLTISLVRRIIESEVFSPIIAPLLSCMRNEKYFQDKERKLKNQMKIAKKLPQSFYGIPLRSISPSSWDSVIRMFKMVSQYSLPCDKIDALVKAAKEIPILFEKEHPKIKPTGLSDFQNESTGQRQIENRVINSESETTGTLISSGKEDHFHSEHPSTPSSPSYFADISLKQSLGADDFIPIFIYVVASSGMEDLYLLKELLCSLKDPHKTSSEDAYYLASFEAAINYILTLDLD